MKRAVLSRFFLSALGAALVCSALTFSPGGVRAAAMSDTEFAELCGEGTAEQIQQALKDGANPDARWKNGLPALIRATGNENDPVGATKALIAAGADVNVVMSNKTALMWAASGTFFRDPEVIRALVAAGADVNARTEAEPEMGVPGGQTALMMAAMDGEAAAIEALLAAGADPNAKAEGGLTALMLAAGFGGADRIAALLAGGAEADARDEDGDTALMRAAANGYPEAVRALLAGGADKTLKNRQGRDALWHARNPENPDEGVSREARDEVIRLLEQAVRASDKPAEKCR